MAASLTTWGAGQFTGMLFGLVPVPASYWVALVTTEPGPGWDGAVLAAAEPPSAAGYARQQLATGAGPDPDWYQQNAYAGNALGIEFGAPTADWGVVTHYALCSAASGGDLYAYSRLLRPVQLTDQSYVVVPPSALLLAFQTFQGDPTA